MKVQNPVTKLNADLKALSTARSSEKTQLAAITKQENAILDQFAQSGTPGDLSKALQKMFALGEKQIQVKDKFGAAIKKDVAAGRADLKPAASHLSLKTLNADRKELGLKPVAHKPAPTGGGEPWHPGKGQLLGSDTSHFQSAATFEKAIKGSQFAAIKATEGTHFVDPSFRSRWNELGKKVASGKMAMRMAYCFLDKGNGKAQADHFLKTLGINGKLKAGTRLALDWEAGALSSPQTLKDAAAEIHKVTGLWPTVYTSASQVSRAKAAVPHAPMWDAQWTNGRSNHSVPFVQYSDGPGYDHDVFNGSLASLRKFAGF